MLSEGDFWQAWAAHAGGPESTLPPEEALDSLTAFELLLFAEAQVGPAEVIGPPDAIHEWADAYQYYLRIRSS